jgi:hypothetical protein
MIETTLIRAARAWRTVAGNGTAVERFVKRRYRKAIRVDRGKNAVQYSNQHAVVVATRDSSEPKRGIYMKGGCDLPSLYLAGPQLVNEIREGSVAIARPASAVGSSQTSQVLQTLDGIDESLVAETCRRLQIRPSFFRATLFDETFVPTGMERFGEFPKTAVVLSIGSDLTRSLHRHREHGFLVDIGGWWLNQSLEKAIKDTDTIRWFKQTFEPVGKMQVEDFAKNMEQVAHHVNEKLGAQLIVLNTLVVEPGNETHNYQLLSEDHSTRKRSFNIALAELSRSLGFQVLDVDRILKTNGVKDQVDFAHFPIEGKLPVANEAFRIFKELEIV